MLSHDEGSEFQYEDPQLAAQEDDWRIAWFVCFELAPLFGPSEHEQELLLDVLGKTESYMRDVSREHRTPDVAWMVAATLLTLSKTILRLQGVEYTPDLARLYLDGKTNEERVNECEWALGALSRAVDLMEHLTRDLDTEGCWTQLAFAYWWKARALMTLGRNDEADEAIDACVRAWETVLEYNPDPAYQRSLSGVLTDQGRLLMARGDVDSFPKASSLFTRAISLMAIPRDLLVRMSRTTLLPARTLR